MYLETERVYLRRFNTGDEIFMFELDSNPLVTKYVGGKQLCMSEYKTYVDSFVDFYKRGKHCGFYKAFLKEDDSFIGWFHLRPERSAPDDFTLLELGYRLKQQYWNKGYATEVSIKIIDKAFAILDATVVSAITLVDNSASARVMEKVGMKFTNKLLYMDQFECVRYAIEKNK